MFKLLNSFLRWVVIKLNAPKKFNFGRKDKITVIRGKFPCNHVAEIRFVDEHGKPNGMVERNNLCTVSQFTPVGDWGAPEPHPHPKFATKCKVQRRRAVAFSCCASCGAVEVVFGYDQRNA